MREPNKRPRRNPLTSEEVANIIAYKKKRELVTLSKLKKSKRFKLLNVFNIVCIFIYLEVLFCYFGPCHYQKHYSVKTVAHFSNPSSVNNKLFISDLDIYDVNGAFYKFVINDFIERPAKTIQFIIGKDFLLQKELKGSLQKTGEAYRLFSATPVLFLCTFFCFISFFGFVMNLNEHIHTLGGITVLNFLTLLTIFYI